MRVLGGEQGIDWQSRICMPPRHKTSVSAENNYARMEILWDARVLFNSEHPSDDLVTAKP